MGLKEKLPLINNSNKGVRIVGYVAYCFVALIVIGSVFGGHDETATTVNAPGNDANSDSANVNDAGPNIHHYTGFGNYTYDGQDEASCSVKKGTDVVHMMAMQELPTDYGYSKDGAQYTITSTGKRIKGYIDYTNDGYVVVVTPRSSVTKSDLMDILGSFQRVG